MEKVKNNQEKYLNYKTEMRRLKTARNEGFNLETILIEYAVMEDRLAFVLKKYNKEIRGINKKIKEIQKLKSTDELLDKYLSKELLDKILKWKNERNVIIHGLMDNFVNEKELRVLGTEGYRLLRTLDSNTRNFAQMFDKKNFK